MDPGRKRLELRTADHVATGDTLMIGSVKWTVQNHWRQGDGTLVLELDRLHGDRTMLDWWVGMPWELVWVRNTLTPQS